MNGKDIELSRRRVLGGIATVGAASAAAGAGTFALFNDEETSDNNTITAGTLNLDGPESGHWTATKIGPGWTGSKSFEATYDEDSTIGSVNLNFSLEVGESDASNTPADTDLQNDLGPTETAQLIEVTTAEVTGPDESVVEDLTEGLPEETEGHPEDENGDLISYLDLSQITTTNEQIATGVSGGDTYTLDLNLNIPTQVGNDLQADGVDIVVTFEAVQPTP